jgi:hypothetical protein
MRRALLEILGQEKYDYLSDQFLDYFFTREDTKVSGVSRIELRENPHQPHDEKDFRSKKVASSWLIGSSRLTLDMHTFPGGQN